jgi:hypothetical protein
VGRNIESLGDVEEPLIKQTSAPELNIDEYVASHARLEGQRLLGQAALDAHSPNPTSDFPPSQLPCRNPVWVVLGGAGGHGSQ